MSDSRGRAGGGLDRGQLVVRRRGLAKNCFGSTALFVVERGRDNCSLCA